MKVWVCKYKDGSYYVYTEEPQYDNGDWHTHHPPVNIDDNIAEQLFDELPADGTLCTEYDLTSRFLNEYEGYNEDDEVIDLGKIGRLKHVPTVDSRDEAYKSRLRRSRR